MKRTSVYNWRYETGEPEFVGMSRIYPSGYRASVPKGWYCTVYTTENEGFEKWMDASCPSGQYTHRFNGGDPMYTVYIPHEADASVFALKWL